MPYSLPLLEAEIDRAAPVYGDTVRLDIAALVERGLATPQELAAWVAAQDDAVWLEGASNPVIRHAYRGRPRALARQKGSPPPCPRKSVSSLPA